MILLYSLAFAGCGILVVALVMAVWAIWHDRHQ